jgi:hypothetical protein
MEKCYSVQLTTLIDWMTTTTHCRYEHNTECFAGMQGAWRYTTLVFVLISKSTITSTLWVASIWLQRSTRTKKQIWSNISRKTMLWAQSCRSIHSYNMQQNITNNETANYPKSYHSSVIAQNHRVTTLNHPKLGQCTRKPSSPKRAWGQLL